jgi:hypothetical protein
MLIKIRAYMKNSIVLGVLLLTSSLAWSADNSVKSMTLDLNNLPHKIVLVDPEVIVKELSVGGVAEKVDEWSNQAKTNINNALNSQIASKHLFDKVDQPTDLPPEQEAALEEHVALYDVVGFNAFYFGRAQFDGWKHKKTEFDYTLGNGLKELADKTGADAALFIVGEDHVSSGGRKAARFFAAVLGVYLPASPTFLSVGLVDLKTGNLLWMNYAVAADTKDLRKPEDVNAMMTELFAQYPGRVAAK